MNATSRHGQLRPSPPSYSRPGSVLRKSRGDERPGTSNSSTTLLHARPSTATSTSSRPKSPGKPGQSLTNHVLRHLDSLESSFDHVVTKQKSRPTTPAQWPSQDSSLLGGVHNDLEGSRSGRNAVGVTSSSSWGSSLRFHRKGSYDSVGGGEEADVLTDVNIANTSRPGTGTSGSSSSGNRRFPPMGFIRRKSSSISGQGTPSAPSAFPSASLGSTSLSRTGTGSLSRRTGKENGGGHSSSNSGSSSGSHHNPIQLPPLSSQDKDFSRTQSKSQEREQKQQRKQADMEYEKSKQLAQSISASAIFPSMAPGSTFTLTMVKPAHTVLPPSSESTSGKHQARGMENASPPSSSFARPPKANPVSRKSISLYETTVGPSVPSTAPRAPRAKHSLSDLRNQPSSSSATPLFVLRRPHPYAEAQSIHVDEDPKSSTPTLQLEPPRNQKKLLIPLPSTKTTTVARTPCTYDVTNVRPVRPRSSSLPIGAESLFPTKPPSSSSGSAAPPSSFPSSTFPDQPSASTMSSSPKTATIPAALARARARTLLGNVTRSDEYPVSEHVDLPAREVSSTAGGETNTLSSGTTKGQPVKRSLSLKVATSLPNMSSPSRPTILDPSSTPSGLSASLATSRLETATTGSSSSSPSRVQVSIPATVQSTGTTSGGADSLSLSMHHIVQQQQPIATPTRAQNRRAAVYRPPPPVDANGVVQPGQPKPALSLSMPSGVSIIHPLDDDEPHIRHSPADLTPPNLSTLFGSQTKNGSPLSPYSASPRGARPPPRAQIPESPTGSPERETKPLPASSHTTHPLSTSPPATASSQRHTPTAIKPSPVTNSPKQTDVKAGVSDNYNKTVAGTANNNASTIANLSTGGLGLPSSKPSMAKPNVSSSNYSSDKYQVVGSSRAFYTASPSSSLPTSYEPKRRPSLPIPSTVFETTEVESDDHLWTYFEKSGLTSVDKPYALPRSRSANVALGSTDGRKDTNNASIRGTKGEIVKSPGDFDLTPRATSHRPSTAGQYATDGRGGLSPFPVQTPQTASSSTSLSTPPLSGGVSPTSPFTLERHVRPRGESNPHPSPSSQSPLQQHQQRAGRSTTVSHTAAKLRLPLPGGTIVLAEPPRVRHVPKPLITVSSAAKLISSQRPGHWASHSSAAALPSPTFKPTSSSPKPTGVGLRSVPSQPSLKSSPNFILLRSSPSIPNLRNSPKPSQALNLPPPSFSSSRALQAPGQDAMASSSTLFHSPFPSPGLGLSLGVTLPMTPVTPATPWLNGKEDADADSIILPPSPAPFPKEEMASRKAVAHTSTGTTDLPYLFPQTPLP